MRERRSSGADRILNRTGDVQFGKSFAADGLVSHGIPHARLASGRRVPQGPGEGHLPTFCQKICQNHYPRREPRPLKVTRPTRRQRSRRQRPDPPRSQTSDEQLLWPPLSPKPEGRQRSQIGRARSATARFFGCVTVPSAVTSAAPGAWRIAWDGAAAVSILRAYWTTSSPARSNGHGGIVSQRANRAYARFARVDALVSHHAHQCVRSFPPVAEQARS